MVIQILSLLYQFVSLCKLCLSLSTWLINSSLLLYMRIGFNQSLLRFSSRHLRNVSLGTKLTMEIVVQYFTLLYFFNYEILNFDWSLDTSCGPDCLESLIYASSFKLCIKYYSQCITVTLREHSEVARRPSCQVFGAK